MGIIHPDPAFIKLLFLLFLLLLHCFSVSVSGLRQQLDDQSCYGEKAKKETRRPAEFWSSILKVRNNALTELNNLSSSSRR
jgi:hypothetical protein